MPEPIEETKTQADPVVPVVPTEADPSKELTADEWKVQIGEKDTEIGDLKSQIEEDNSRAEALQDSLDSALEEINSQNENPPVESKSEPKVEPPVNEGDKDPKVDPPVTEVKDVNLNKDIEQSIREDDDFRKEQNEKLNDVLQSNAERDLREEVDSALSKHPEANRGEILLAIEDGSENSVDDLAQNSAERIKADLEKTHKSIEDNLKEQFSKEKEGGISVPQSSGGSSSPEKATEVSPVLSPDDQWGAALEASKAESKGE